MSPDGPGTAPPASGAFARAWARRDQVVTTPSENGLFVCLAPMDGVTDHVYRDLITATFGGRSGVSLCVSEFVRVTDHAPPPSVFRRHCPELDHGGVTPAGVPVFVQLLGGRPEPMAAAASRAVQLGAPGIDLNFGCPAKTVNRHDGGAALLKAPRRVRDVTAAVRAAVPAHVPVTVKIRVGWDSADPLVELGHAAEDAGAAWLTVHARTRAQLYRPPVRWAALAAVSRALSIPVVANGDIVDAASLRACAEASECHAFMIGRGAMGRPDVFAEVRGWTARPMTTEEFARLLIAYAAAMCAAGRGERGALARLKQWLRMGSDARGDVALWFEEIKRMQRLDDAVQALTRATPEKSGTIRAHERPSLPRRLAHQRARA